MKRKREIEILRASLEKTGLSVTPAVLDAVSAGLKTIRQEKFEERRRAKLKISLKSNGHRLAEYLVPKGDTEQEAPEKPSN